MVRFYASFTREKKKKMIGATQKIYFSRAYGVGNNLTILTLACNAMICLI